MIGGESAGVTQANGISCFKRHGRSLGQRMFLAGLFHEFVIRLKIRRRNMSWAATLVTRLLEGLRIQLRLVDGLLPLLLGHTIPHLRPAIVRPGGLLDFCEATQNPFVSLRRRGAEKSENGFPNPLA